MRVNSKHVVLFGVVGWQKHFHLFSDSCLHATGDGFLCGAVHFSMPTSLAVCLHMQPVFILSSSRLLLSCC